MRAIILCLAAFWSSAAAADIRAVSVTRMSDWDAVTGNVTQQGDNDMKRAFDDPLMNYVPAGRVSIGGRTGTAYRIAGDPGSDIVISDDPALAPLARAMSRYLETKWGFVRGTRFYSQVDVMLKKGAPLAFMDENLVSVSFEPLPSGRFQLPVKPKTREEIRAWLQGIVVPNKVPAPPH